MTAWAVLDANGACRTVSIASQQGMVKFWPVVATRQHARNLRDSLPDARLWRIRKVFISMVHVKEEQHGQDCA